MRVSSLALLLALAACAPLNTAAAPPRASSGTALVNGVWFDGERFRPRAVYVADGRFTDIEPVRIDSVIDLRGGFVVPPFGDAHTHNLDGPQRLEMVRDAYLREGTLYVQVLTNSQRRAAAVRDRFNRPGTLDVVYAHGGLTSTLSHPFQAYEPFAMGLYDPNAWREREQEIRQSRILENDAYWFIDSLEDLDAKWPRFLAGKPDLVKIFLLDARNRAGREGLIWDGPGLRPELVPEIVRRARHAGLRVAAHVETVDDAEIALAAGVAVLAHLPGYSMGAKEEPGAYRITGAVARLARAQGAVVMANAFLAAGYTAGDSAHRARVQALQRENLRRFMDAGVPIVLGSDMFGRTARGELYSMRDLGLWDNRELIRIWSMVTPRSMFPGRMIGSLEPGYEASMLVLECDPIARLECVEQIRFRLKQGELVAVGPPPGDGASRP